jgi:TonB-linked SusC/RagA family outer membrane protein
MRKITFLLAFLLFVGMNLANAQTRTIHGTIVDSEDGQGIPGVTITVKGTTVGTTTDLDGKYSLEVKPEYETLQFSYVGMKTVEITLSDQTEINVTLEPDVMQMDEVVVTALGVSREKKTLGYAVQDVSGDQLNQAKTDNVLNALSGRVAGVQVTNASGAVGASTRITIRGNSSFRSDNQPLFVVDGVPISNYSSGVSQWGGADFGNAIMDIDPENIESMTVLKGASAAALYGSRALNGVILITTKKGKANNNGLGVTYSYNVGFDKVYILPKYQNKYGQAGYGSEYAYNQYLKNNENGHTADNYSYQQYTEEQVYSYYDGNWGGVNDGWDESWGSRLDIGLKLNQFDSPYTLDAEGNPVYEATPWVSHPDNVKDFFNTGVNQTHNVAITGGNDKATGRLSYVYNDVQGVIPNTDMYKNSVNFTGTYKMTDRFQASANVTYTNNYSSSLPGNGYDPNNVMQSLGSWFGRQVNMQSLKDHWMELDPFGKPYTWSYYYHNNPYWTAYKNTSSRNRNRVMGNATLKYDINNWLNITFRAGTDFWSESRKHVIYNMSNESKKGGGSFWESTRNFQETNIDLYLNFDKSFGKDGIHRISGLAGANYRNNSYLYNYMRADELTVPNFFDIGNAKGTANVDMYKSLRTTNSVYAQVDYSFKDFLFLGATIRGDWSSTLPSGDWNYWYPSVNAAFILTNLIEVDPKVLTFAKIRASFAKVGGDADPYSLYNFYQSATPFAGVSLYHYLRQNNNPNLRPETQNSWEIGLDLKFWNGRVGVDFTYYDQKTTDQIMAIDVANSTGFDSRWINAGEIGNSGVELGAYVDIFKSKNFSWGVDFNWAKNKNVVNSLYGDLESYQIGSSWGGLSIQARPGETYGIIKGYAFLRDDNGNIIVDGSGLPERTGTLEELGNIVPDWTGGINNRFTFGNTSDWGQINFNFLIDGRKGGDIFSVTKMFGLYAGILEQTADNNVRETGAVAGLNAMTNESFVHEDGSALNTDLSDPNNSDIVAPSDFYYNAYKLHEWSIIDGSFIKLREISVGYALPKRLFENSKVIKGFDVSVYAHNVALLWVDSSNDIKIDPETAFGNGNSGQGIEQYQLPATRTIGFKFSVRF